MKDNRIAEAWDQVRPDDQATERMRSAILVYGREHQAERTGGRHMRQNSGRQWRWDRTWKWLAPAVVCLAMLAVGASGIYRSQVRQVETVDMGNGEMLRFYWGQGVASEAKIAVEGSSRRLTEEEVATLFGSRAQSEVSGMFQAEDHALVRVEGWIGDTKVILAAPGIPVLDTVIVAEEHVSMIQGVPVSAGCFVTSPNSRGERTIIYFASFSLGEVSAYTEIGGPLDDSVQLRETMAGMIEQMIEHGEPKLGEIVK